MYMLKKIMRLSLCMTNLLSLCALLCTHKLNHMIFFSMYILNRGTNNANNDRRAREERARCAHLCAASRRRFLLTRARTLSMRVSV